MSSRDVKFALRLPAKLHADVKALAQKDVRSTNAQITVMIQEAIANRKAKEVQQADNDTANKEREQDAHQAINSPHQLSIEDIPGVRLEAALTPKQKELLELLLHEDLSYRELSQMLNINASSVRDRTSTILRKLGLESRAELLDKFKEKAGNTDRETLTERQPLGA